LSIAGYNGELLPVFYDEWVIFEREHLQAIYEDRLNLLLDQLITFLAFHTIF
jgi:hypothetical protein